MTLTSSDLWAKLFYYLAEPAVRALALAALAGLALALARAKDVALRLAAWTAVLYVSLAMPFLARLAPTVPVPMPAFLTARSAFPPTQESIRGAVASPENRVSRAQRLFTPGPVPAVQVQPQELTLQRPQRSICWQFAAVTLYLLVVAVLLGRLAAGFYFSRRLKLRSSPMGEQRELRFLFELSRRWGLRTAPGLAESPAVAVPVTLGWQRAVILLPLAWRNWSEEKTQAVLAHELSHVARKDALTRTLAAIHRSIFWFSPLSWWLERQLAVLAEQASDDAAVRAGTDRVFYAEILLGFFQDLRRALGRVRWEGVAMTRGRLAQERVDRILDSSRPISAGLGKPAWALLALLAVPVVWVLAGARPIVAQRAQPENHPSAVAANAAAATEGQVAAATPQSPPAPAVPAEPQPAPAGAPASKPPKPPAPRAGFREYGDWHDDVAITYGVGRFSGSGTFRDSDMEHITALRRASSGDIIWFRSNGKAYVIHDPATVRRAKDLYADEKRVEEVQGKLQAKQEAFIAQQEELHKRLDQVRVDVPDLSAQLTKLQAEVDQLHKQGATLDELNRLQSALKDLQAKLSELQGEAGGKLGGIGGEQGALGAKMAELGDQQRDLTEIQANLEKENARKMLELLDDALAKGLAQPE